MQKLCLGSRRRRTGLSLVEVTVSLSIMFVVSTFVMGMFAAACRMPVHIQQRTAVTEQARAYLEYMLDSPASSLVSSSGPLPSGFPSGYRYTQVVTPSALDSNVYSIDVTVTNTSPGGLSQELRALKRSFTPNPGYALMVQYGCFSCHTLASGPLVPPGYPTNMVPLNKTGLNADVAAYSLPNIQTLVTNRLNNPNADMPAGFPSPSTMTNFSSMPVADQQAIANYLAQNAPR